jgi:hypothetical protein
MGPASPAERQAVIAASPVAGLYDAAVDRNSAYEVLAKRAERAAEDQRQAQARADAERTRSRGHTGSGGGRRRQSATETMAKSVLRSAGRTIGRELVRGLLGSLFKGR